MLLYPQNNNLEDEILDVKNMLVNINNGLFFATNLVNSDG